MNATISNILGTKRDSILTISGYDESLLGAVESVSQFKKTLIQIKPWVASSRKQDFRTGYNLLECLPQGVRLPESIPTPLYRVSSGRIRLALDHTLARSPFSQYCIRIASWFLGLGCGIAIVANVKAQTPLSAGADAETKETL